MTDAPKGLRLTAQEGEQDGCQEIVLRVQGALCFVQLPPIRAGQVSKTFGVTRNTNSCRRAPLPDKGDARFLKQVIRLTGFGSDDFEKAVEGIANIATFMGEHLERGDIESWRPERFRCWKALELGNRYFVHQNSEGDMIPVPLPSSIDPDGVLTALAGDEWVHTEENEVSYYRLTVNSDGKPR